VNGGGKIFFYRFNKSNLSIFFLAMHRVRSHERFGSAFLDLKMHLSVEREYDAF
jgi:hypothetical protein